MLESGPFKTHAFVRTDRPVKQTNKHTSPWRRFLKIICRNLSWCGIILTDSDAFGMFPVIFMLTMSYNKRHSVTLPVSKVIYEGDTISSTFSLLLEPDKWYHNSPNMNRAIFITLTHCTYRMSFWEYILYFYPGSNTEGVGLFITHRMSGCRAIYTEVCKRTLKYPSEIIQFSRDEFVMITSCILWFWNARVSIAVSWNIMTG